MEEQTINDIDLFDDEDDLLNDQPIPVENDWMLSETEDENWISDDDDPDGDDGDRGDNGDDNHDDDNHNEPTDLLTELLKAKGISDPSKIKFQNENDEIEEIDWNDLSVEEQLNILQDSDSNSPESDTNDLDDDEIDLINRIRLSGMSINDYIELERLKGINAYAQSLQQENEPTYMVNDYTDDELFVLDLQTKIEDLSLEEAIAALEQAKSNETLYAKQIAGLRNEYKLLEEDKIARELAIAEQERQEQFAIFSNNIANSINNFNSLGSLDINMEDDDALQLYQFITGTDPAGVNYFAKALNDPDTLTRVAWFALHGEDVINSIEDYYKNVIAQVSKNQYQRGLNEGKGKSTKKPDVVILPKKRQRITESIDDLD